MFRFRGVFLIVLAGLALTTALPEARGQAKDKAKRSADRMRNYLKQLGARFDGWDANRDGTLDATELAKAFRGAGAIPLDKLKTPIPPDGSTTPMPPTVDYSQTGKPKTTCLALITLPQQTLSVNGALAELLVDRPMTPPPKVTPPPMIVDFTGFGDFLLLSLAGKGTDFKLRRPDFDAYAKTFAHTLDRVQEGQFEVSQAKTHLAKAKTAKQKTAAQNDLARAEGDLARAQAEWTAIPLPVRQTLNIKP